MATDIKDLFNSSIYAKLRIANPPLTFRTLIDNGIATEGDLIFDVGTLPYGAFHTLGQTFYFFNRDLYNNYITDLHDPRYVRYLPSNDVTDNSVTNKEQYTHDVSILGKLFLNNITSSLKLTVDVLDIDGKTTLNALTLNADATSDYKPYIDVSAYTKFDGLSIFYGGWPTADPSTYQDLATILSKLQTLILERVTQTDFDKHVTYIKDRIDITDASVLDLSNGLIANEIADASLTKAFFDASAIWDQRIDDISTDLYALEDDVIEHIEYADNRFDKIEETHANDHRYILTLINDSSNRIADNADRISVLNSSLYDFRTAQESINLSNNNFQSSALQYLSQHTAEIAALANTDKLHDAQIADLSTRLFDASTTVDTHTVEIGSLRSWCTLNDSSITTIFGMIDNVKKTYVTLSEYNANNTYLVNKITTDINAAVNAHDTSVKDAINALSKRYVSRDQYHMETKVINKALFDLDSRVYTHKTKLYELEHYTIPLVDASLQGYIKIQVETIDASIKKIQNKLDKVSSLNALDSSVFQEYAADISTKLSEAANKAVAAQLLATEANAQASTNKRNIEQMLTDISINEFVIGTAFNDVNKRLLDLSTNVSSYYVTYDYLSNNMGNTTTGQNALLTTLKNNFEAFKKTTQTTLNALDSSVGTIDTVASLAIIEIYQKIQELEMKFNQYVTILALLNILKNFTPTGSAASEQVAYLTENEYKNLAEKDPDKLYAITNSNG